jgi:hypothetical protein
MSPVVRLLVAGALLLLGLTAVLFLTGERGACLGPIGVTEVECAATTGIVTTLGFGVPAFFASVFAAVLVLSPMAAQAGLRVLPAAIFGGLTAGLAFVALRPVTMEGLTWSGSWASIPRPLDPGALATAMVLGAFVGALVWWARWKQRGMPS